jgi:hypothetical protein
VLGPAEALKACVVFMHEFLDDMNARPVFLHPQLVCDGGAVVEFGRLFSSELARSRLAVRAPRKLAMARDANENGHHFDFDRYRSLREVWNDIQRIRRCGETVLHG